MAEILNKEALVTAIAAETGATKADAGKMLDATLAAIKKGLVEGKDVRHTALEDIESVVQ
mgnify:CR=1 FL=1